jgi:hypothetical protein
MNEQQKGDVIQSWVSKIDWEKRVKAVCKPCWELKYCPYGPLVEQFPLPIEDDPRSCRIFGHECPVFSVAEPFTETKQLRNISRRIPRPVQFRVLKRDNQICRKCTQPIADEDINFDHIIPWSKGGPTEESNIQLLCGKCNKEKSNRFENDNLISSFREHVVEPISSEILEFLLFMAEFRHSFFKEHQRLPTVSEFAEEFNDGKLTNAETRAIEIIHDLDEFFGAHRPVELSQKVFSSLRLRWGYSDGRIYNIREASMLENVSDEDLMKAEIGFVERLGWRIDQSKKGLQKWLRT